MDNKENTSEPAGPETGSETTELVAGSETCSGHSQKLQAMQAYINESLTPLDDGTIPSRPSSEEVNNMFSMVVGGPKKGRMYGCGSMASTFYPDQMARRPHGGSSSSSRGSQDMERMREEWETQKRVNEHLRMDLEATQTTLKATQHENASLKDRMTILEGQVRQLVAGLPQPRTSRRVLYGRGSSSRGRALAGSSHLDEPYAIGSSHRRLSGKGLMYSSEYIPPSQDFGHDGGDGDVFYDAETYMPQVMWSYKGKRWNLPFIMCAQLNAFHSGQIHQLFIHEQCVRFTFCRGPKKFVYIPFVKAFPCRSFFVVEDFLDDNNLPYTYQKGKNSMNPTKHISFKQRTVALWSHLPWMSSF